ncbi:MAG: hypothetical protein HC874_27345 [Richelia sp. SL_2_1]|nr:hypothetical protein [Richelia sp. SL_2_1]
MASTAQQKEVKTRWPVEEGLTAGTTKQTGRVTNLVPEKSFVREEEKIGLD